MKTHKLTFPLVSAPRSLKDMVSLLGTSSEEISKTSLVYLENNLFFHYDMSGARRSMTYCLSGESGVMTSCLELMPGLTLGRIHYYLAMYSLATKVLNCHIRFSLKGRRFTVLISPLDEKSSVVLNSLEGKEPPADEFKI